MASNIPFAKKYYLHTKTANHAPFIFYFSIFSTRSFIHILSTAKPLHSIGKTKAYCSGSCEPDAIRLPQPLLGKFSDNGFKLLINEGTYCRNARYNYLLTQAYPGVATIATGANPSVHGIISDKWYNRNTGNEVEATADEKVNTVGGSFFSG